MVIDAVHQTIDITPELIQRWADRHRGVGFDQLLLVEPTHQPDTDFFYRIFNANGSEVGQCGNGARCLAQFIRRHALSNKTDLILATQTRQLHVHIQQDNLITVDMGIPLFHPSDIPFIAAEEQNHYTLTLAEHATPLSVVNIGNPHAVIDVDDCDAAPVELFGHALNQHPHFPEGVNVGFRQILSPQHIRLRVYERGVGETLACGSGACAAAILGIRDHVLTSPVTVTLNGGDLSIAWPGRHMPASMTGPATHVYDGVFKKE